MPLAHARHILVKTKDDAENIKQQLADGSDFATLAKNTPRVTVQKVAEI